MSLRSGTRPLSHTLKVFGIGLAALILPIGLASPAVANTGGHQQETESSTHWHGTEHSSNHEQSNPTTWTVLAGSESKNQAIQGMAFLPKDVYIDAGDTVTWLANSAEIHTVTFLAAGQALESLQPFDPSNPSELLKVNGSVYDGVSYYNSGILTNVSDSGFPAATSYSLTFPTAGTFTYYCLVHGMVMQGTVHVAAAGTPYPFTQAQYNHQATVQEAAILRDGYRLWARTRRAANSHTVYEGADDGVAMVMRFIRPTVTVHVGESVTFVNNGMGAPHTVTFGTEPENAFIPLGDPTNYTGGQLNSGIQLPGSSFTVTFNKAGTFDYLCALHDYMGMVGRVIVRP
jgi:plastocyanin